MRERFYENLTSIYRILVIFIVITMHYQEIGDLQSSILLYAILIGYGVTFSFLPNNNKWISYLEIMSLLGLIFYYQINNLYFLSLVPFVHLVSSKINKLDLLIVTSITSVFLYFYMDNQVYLALIVFGIFMSLMLFNFKFNHIYFLENNLFEERERVQKAQIEKSNLERENKLMERMYMQSLGLFDINEEKDIIETLLNSTMNSFNAHYVCLYEEKGDDFVLVKEVGKNDKYEIYQKIKIEEGKIPIIKSELLRLPIEHEGETWGMIAIYGKRDKVGSLGQMAYFPFQEEDYESMMVYTRQVMSKLKEIRLLKRNEYLANYDFLTGIANRRNFHEKFEFLLEQAKRGDDLSVLILDIDFFKSFNDTYGHDTGDEVLKIVAQTLTDAVRKADVVGRLGGEEFGVLLPKNKGNALQIAERIRRKVEEIEFVREITISIGVAHFGVHGETIDELSNNADKALYGAKEGGRNRVVEFSYDGEYNTYISDDEFDIFNKEMEKGNHKIVGSGPKDENKNDKTKVRDVSSSRRGRESIIDLSLNLHEVDEENDEYYNYLKEEYDYEFDDKERYDYEDDYYKKNYSDNE